MPAYLAGRERLDDIRRRLTLEWLVTAASLGVVAGIVAGAALPLLTLSVALIAGESIWDAPRAVARTFFGQLYVGGGAVAGVLLGTGLHLLLAAGFGIMFAIVAGLARRPLTMRTQLIAGLLWGLGRWSTNTFVIAPRLPGGQQLSGAIPPWSWLCGHLLYGALLGLLYARWQRERPTLPWIRLAAIKAVGGALAVECAILLGGLVLFEAVSPRASFAFALAIIVGALLALWPRAARQGTWLWYGGLWALIGGLSLLLWNTLRTV